MSGMRGRSRRRIEGILSTALLALASAAAATTPRAETAPPTRVQVERADPPKETRETLRFLRENRDFLRRRVDALRVVPLETADAGTALDPRYPAHGEVLAGALRDLDSLRTTAEERVLLSSITELGDLEAELDSLEALLVAQNERLARLEADFLRDHGTELVVVLRGVPDGELPASLRVVDGFGDLHTLALTESDRMILQTGGILEIAHVRAEPREQTWSVAAEGGVWSPTASPLTFEPPRPQLTYLELDLTGAQPKTGAGGLAIAAWVDAAVSSRGPGPR